MKKIKLIKSIKKVVDSPLVSMGPIRLRQPIPNQGIAQVDPFILLHHYGPYAISEFNNPFDLGSHPHRGFEPITLLFKGEQLHRDSLGNEMLVKAGDVQWTTAGRGIIHAEGPTKEFVLKGGELEGIQLWLNLPASKKMMQPAYQHVKSEDFNVIENDDKTISLKIVAGEQLGLYGRVLTQTPVNVYVLKSTGEGELDIEIPKDHESLVYLLDGEIIVNNEQSLKKGMSQMATFNQDGNFINIHSKSESNVLILSGEAINEKVTQHGPYVMNTQTEIMEAMRDYQQGKMGFLPN